MPLPQIEPQPKRKPPKGKYGGFILKNFAFTERLRFNGTSGKEDPPDLQDEEALAVVAGAPNRGGTYTQFSHALFYEQQVRFAEGPDDGKIVHVENGAWLQLGSTHQNIGPYNPPAKPIKGQVLRQPPYVTIAKQIAVPHGNSVLALGGDRPQRSRPLRRRQEGAHRAHGPAWSAGDPRPVRSLPAARRFRPGQRLPGRRRCRHGPVLRPLRAAAEGQRGLREPQRRLDAEPELPTAAGGGDHPAESAHALARHHPAPVRRRRLGHQHPLRAAQGEGDRVLGRLLAALDRPRRREGRQGKAGATRRGRRRGARRSRGRAAARRTRSGGRPPSGGR